MLNLTFLHSHIKRKDKVFSHETAGAGIKEKESEYQYSHWSEETTGRLFNKASEFGQCYSDWTNILLNKARMLGTHRMLLKIQDHLNSIT